MIKKRCQIRARNPITCFQVPIVGSTELNLTPEEIRKCLCSKAEVAEILADGTIVPLGFSNYDKDNSPKQEPVEAVKLNETEKVIELKDEVSIEEVVEPVTEPEEAEEEQVEIKEEKQDTVKDYKVSSRNNNKNYKKAKNKR